MWWILFIILFAIILLHIVIPKTYHWPSTMRKFNKFKGPRGVPYFNNALTFVVSNDEFLPLVSKLMNEYKPIFKLSVLGTLFIFMSEVEDIEVILKSTRHIKKGIDYFFFGPWLGEGLLTSSGKKWFDHRKWLTPAFHFSILEQYIDIINDNVKILSSIIDSMGNNAEVKINSLISKCTLDVICETAMGTKVNAQLGGEKEYIRYILRMSQIFIERSLKPWLYRPCIFNITPLGREQKRALKFLHNFTDEVIEKRRLAYKEEQALKKSDQSKYNEFGAKKKMSFLDLLIELSETQNKLTKEEIREEVDTFMFEGHDTTSAAISWALFNLGSYPEIQENVYKEQCEIFQGSNRQANSSDLSEMKYLELVIKETLRMYPSVPMISRVVEEDVQIRDNIIPAGAQIPILIHYIHRNPKIYPNPNKFDPERFLPDNFRNHHPYSYIPFSAGPRNCIGQKFAMMEEKLILSHLVRKYKITSLDKIEDIKIMGELILRPKENLRMTFTRRET